MLFFVDIGPLEVTEIVLWIVSCVVLAIVGILFLSNSRKMNNKFYLWISLFFLFFIPARIFRIIVKFILGEPPVGEPLTGDALFFEIIYTCTSFTGLFFVYFAIERTIVKKTHFLFSIFVILTTIVSIIDFITRAIFFITMPFFIITILGLPIIFLNLARNSSGYIRKNAIIITLGILLFEFGIAFDIPDAQFLWEGFPDIFLAIAPPVMQIFAIIILRKRFLSAV